MADVSINNVVKRFGAVTAVDAVNLDLASGEFVALLGPSGCGKTTLLRLIAGFEAVDGGRIAIDDEVVSAPGLHVATEARRIGMVFQSYALWPHMTVAQNVAFALRLRHLGAAEIERTVASALEMVGLAGLGGRRPAALSGGQRQRVALARCLAMRPRVVLLDEPLSNLDAHLRDQMQEEFRAFHRQSGATMIYVTHDQAEALALADRVAVMIGGRLRQVDTPRVLYDQPVDSEVARFIGKGSVVPVTVEAVGDGQARLTLADATLTLRARSGQAIGPALASIRPEAAAVVGDSGGLEQVSGRVVAIRYSGARQEVTLELPAAGNARLRAIAPAGMALADGQSVQVAITDGWVIAPQ